MKLAARSITRRTGVSAVPMISYDVISAPSQCVKSMMSAPAMPGKKYLLPPLKPTTSCGKTGPQISRLIVIEDEFVQPHRHILDSTGRC